MAMFLRFWLARLSYEQQAQTDRVVEADYLGEKYPERRDVLRARWRQSLVWERPGDS